MGKIGWGTIYAAQVLIAAPAVAGTAVVAVGFWVEEAVRKATGGPVRWQVDDRDEERVSRQLAHFAAELNRAPAPAPARSRRRWPEGAGQSRARAGST